MQLGWWTAGCVGGLALALTAACSFKGDGNAGDASTPIDAAVADGAPATDADVARCTSFANGVSLTGTPAQSLELQPDELYRIDLTGVAGAESRVLSSVSSGSSMVEVDLHTREMRDIVLIEVDRFVMGSGSALRIEGDMPVIIVASGIIEIAGLIDISGGCVGSADRTCPGPGGVEGPADVAVVQRGCGSGGHGDGANGGTPEHGGGGAGFATAGGVGGGDTGGTAGVVCDDLDLDPLTGGSAGGAGAVAPDGGEGGGGGGGLQLSSAVSVTFLSAASKTIGINAGGAGGGPGAASDGGGGGGAGGGILLEAPSIRLAAGVILAANGGGGGGGGNPGNVGADGRLASAAAPGGTGDFSGGAGGFAATPPSAGSGEGGDDDTGGGGGSVGVIRLHVEDSALVSQATMSPPPSLGPACSE